MDNVNAALKYIAQAKEEIEEYENGRYVIGTAILTEIKKLLIQAIDVLSECST